MLDFTRNGIEQESVEEKEESTNNDHYVVPSLPVELDTGTVIEHYRRKFWQVWCAFPFYRLLPKNPPPPPPLSLEHAELTPLAGASFFSRITFSWVSEIMVLGYQRTLQASDLYKLDSSRQAGILSEKFEVAWSKRVKSAEEWNAKLASGEIRPSVMQRLVWILRAIPSEKNQKSEAQTYSERLVALEQRWKEIDGLKEASLAWALNDVFGWSFWLGGVFKVSLV
ncbi:hypothetical protein ID866_6927 [Astraeus odoratus]|nr:hypothetical protein ID866_6927 [Astraeus odoratus]